MSKKLRVVVVKGLAVLTFGFATVTGATHLVQSNDGALTVADLGRVQLASAQPGVPTAAGPRAPQLPARALTPGEALSPVVKLPAGAVPAPTFSGTPAACELSFTATLSRGTMVDLDARAPCAPNTRIAIRQGHLVFDSMTDDSGRFHTAVPGLDRMATFDAEIAGETKRVNVDIPDFEVFDRVALQWQGQTGLNIHALEFGATHGGDGHIWAGKPQSAQRADNARGGFLTRLGLETLRDGRMAEIYVFPAGQAHRSGAVRISAGAEITALSCGRLVAGQALQPGADGALAISELTIEMPGCDAIGDILVLKNLIRDMKVAAN